jgi:hypothetical protein
MVLQQQYRPMNAGAGTPAAILTVFPPPGVFGEAVYGFGGHKIIGSELWCTFGAISFRVHGWARQKIVRKSLIFSQIVSGFRQKSQNL